MKQNPSRFLPLRDLLARPGAKRCLSSFLITILLILFAFIATSFHAEKKDGILKNAYSSQEIAVVRIHAKPAIKKQKPLSPKRNPKKQIPKEVIPQKVEKIQEREEIHEEVQEDTQNEITENTNEETAATTNRAETQENSEFAESAEEKQARESYKKYAIGRIAAKKVYPRSARTKGHEGRVKMRVEIAPDGTVQSAEILSPSDFSSLNEASLAAVKKAAPFKKLPPELHSVTLIFSIDYSLSE